MCQHLAFGLFALFSCIKKIVESCDILVCQALLSMAMFQLSSVKTTDNWEISVVFTKVSKITAYT